VGYNLIVSLHTAFNKGRDSRMIARSTSGPGFGGIAIRISSRRRVWISGWVDKRKAVHVNAEDVVSWLTHFRKETA
jgi:hypothetical protein